VRGHLRKRGDAWELRAYAGRDPVSNREMYRTRTFRGGKREAERALGKFVQEVAGGGHAAHDATVGALVGRWFDLAKADLSPSTVRGYERSIRRYIEPALGDVPLDPLRVAQIDELYAQLRTGGGEEGGPLATATIRQVHAVLRRALQQGVKWGWIDSNPAALASPPRVRNRLIEAPEPTVVARLIEKAGDDNPDFGAFLQIAATTGARRGEICALHWDDVDFERGTVTIARSVVDGIHGELIEKDTKTHSVRRVALDHATLKVLLDHRDRCRWRATACGTNVSSAAYVFSREADSSLPMKPNDFTHAFIVLRDRLGLRGVRLHDLRHFAATRLLAAGIPVRTVSGRLGHANAATTLGVYAHFLAESDREAADTIGEILMSSKAASGSAEGAPQGDHSTVHWTGVIEGEFNWSSQHLDEGEVCDGRCGAPACREGDARFDEVSGASVSCPSRGSRPILGGDRPRRVKRGSCQGTWFVHARRLQVVSTGWRDATYFAGPSHGPLPVVHRARGDCDLARPAGWCPRDRPSTAT